MSSEQEAQLEDLESRVEAMEAVERVRDHCVRAGVYRCWPVVQTTCFFSFSFTGLT